MADKLSGPSAGTARAPLAPPTLEAARATSGSPASSPRAARATPSSPARSARATRVRPAWTSLRAGMSNSSRAVVRGVHDKQFVKIVKRSRDAAVFSFTATRLWPRIANVFESWAELNHMGFWSQPTKRNWFGPCKAAWRTRKRNALHQAMRRRLSLFDALTLYRRLTALQLTPYLLRHRYTKR